MTDAVNFAPLLNELRMIEKYTPGAPGRPPSLAKSTLPTHFYEEEPPLRVARISRSRHSMTMSYEGGDRTELHKILRDMETLNKSVTSAHETTLAVDRKKAQREELRKSIPAMIEQFTASLRKATMNGAITGEEACLLETRRNHFVQHCANRGLL